MPTGSKRTRNTFTVVMVAGTLRLFLQTYSRRQPYARLRIQEKFK